MHFVQTSIDITAATRHVGHRRDTDFTVKTVLTEAFGGTVVRPWAIAGQQQQWLTVVGYSELSADDITRRKIGALPSLTAAVGEVYGYAMPEFREGEQFTFVIRLCPTIHVTKAEGRRYGERDAFLCAVADADQDGELDREQIYVDYLRERLSGARIENAQMERFQLSEMARKSAKKETGFAKKTVPDATIGGLLAVTEPEVFQQALTNGVGRQRAFGFGMVRLKPPQLGG